MIQIIEGPPPEFEPIPFGYIDYLGGTSKPKNIYKTKVRAFSSDAIIKKITEGWVNGDSTFTFPSPILDLTQESANIVACIKADQLEGNAVDLYITF